MKKLISTLFLFLGLLAFSQAGIKFDDGNFSSLLAKAKKENKLIFLDAYASWCGPCKLMAKISLHYNLLVTIITAIL